MNQRFYLMLTLVLLYALDPFTYGFVFGYLLLFVLLIRIKRTLVVFDGVALSLAIFSLVYSLFYAFDTTLGSQFIIIYATVPTTLYITGRLLYSSKNPFKNFVVLIIIGVFFSISTISSVLIDIVNEGFVKLKRDVPLIWTGELIPATNMAAGCALNMCIPGIILLGGKVVRKKSILIALISIFIISLICVLRLGSRTQLALSIFTLLLAIFYKIRKQNFKQNLGMFLLIFMAVNVGISYVTLDTESELLSAYADRADSKTNGVDSAGGRTNKWGKSLSQMFDEPLGWDLTEFGFSHNLWFDATRVGGLISLSLLMIFTILALKKIYSLFKLHDKPKLLDGQLIIYCTCFFLSFFVEPILEGYFILFSLFCLVLGFIASHISATKNTVIET